MEAEARVTLEQVLSVGEAFGTRVALAGDGHRWVSSSGRQLQLRRDEHIERQVSAPDAIHDLRFSRDGRTLLAAPFVFDLAAGAFAPLRGLDERLAPSRERAGQFALEACALSPDGGELVASARFLPPSGIDAVDDYHGPRYRLLRIRGDEVRALDEGLDSHRAIAVGERVIAAGGVTIDVWSRESGQKVAALAHHQRAVRSLELSGDGRLLAAVDAAGTITIWDTAGWTLRHAWQGHDGDVSAIVLHPRLPLAATAGDDGAVRVWSLVEPGRLLGEQRLGGPV
jgi:WD40 repeat protein